MKQHRELHNNNKLSSFQNCLWRIPLPQCTLENIKTRATETYKFLQGLSPPILNEIFVERNNNYSLWVRNVLNRRGVNSIRYGTETVSFLAPKIWDILPKKMKDSESLDIFKRKTKTWIPWKCSCRLCKTYVPQAGFTWAVKIKDTYHWLSWRQLTF